MNQGFDQNGKATEKIREDVLVAAVCSKLEPQPHSTHSAYQEGKLEIAERWLQQLSAWHIWNNYAYHAADQNHLLDYIYTVFCINLINSSLFKN